MWWISAAWAAWPDLDRPPRVGDGADDAALIVGIEDYWAVPDVPGATRNARDWYAWFTVGRGTPASRVQLLLDQEATAEQIEAQAARMAEVAGPQGTVWIVFIGHGAPDPSGTDALLLGADVQQTAQSIVSRGVSRNALLDATAGAGDRVLVLDSCFSGRSQSGEPLVPGLQPVVPTWALDERDAIELTAGASDQFAGPLPGENRPAFSYLVLGALHGWGDADGDGTVTASEAVAWSRDALATTLLDRRQVPQHSGTDRPLARAGSQKGPDLRPIVEQRARAARPVVTMPELPAIPQVQPGIGVDVALEQRYWDAIDATADPLRSPRDTASAWCRLASFDKGAHAYGEVATRSCEEWTGYATAHEELWRGLRRDYADAAALLKLDRASVDGKLAALDALQSTYGDAGIWSLKHVERARRRVADGQRARLPALHEPPEWTAKGDGQRGFFWGWDRVAAQHVVVSVRLGAGSTTDGTFIGEGQPAMAVTAGPVDGGLLNLTAGGGTAYLRFYGGLAPFAVRPSRRVPGELRGSWVNPIVGLGYRIGKQDGQDAKWLDGYVADHVWITNGIGLRLEYRHPLLGPPVPGAALASVVLNPSGISR